MEELNIVTLNMNKDQPIWELDRSKKYTTKSTYREATFKGVISWRMDRLWSSKLPMIVKVFMWMVMQDRIESGEQLKKKMWKGDSRCILCNKIE